MEVSERSGSTESEQERSGGAQSQRGGRKDGGKSSRSWVRWSEAEHAQLTRLVEELGVNRSWSAIAAQIPGRTGKQCRERWLNHTSADTKKGNWSSKEEFILASEHSVHGSQWCRITRCLPGRTDNSVKNHWNATWRSKVMHKPQSILWLYSTEMKNGLEPQAALRAALLKWENNVPAHQVIETLGFWPSQQYANGNLTTVAGSAGKVKPDPAGPVPMTGIQTGLQAGLPAGIQIQMPAAGLNGTGGLTLPADMLMQGGTGMSMMPAGAQLAIVKPEQLQQQLPNNCGVMAAAGGAVLAGTGGQFGGPTTMLLEMGPNGEVSQQVALALQQQGMFLRQLQPSLQQQQQQVPQQVVVQASLPEQATATASAQLLLAAAAQAQAQAQAQASQQLEQQQVQAQVQAQEQAPVAPAATQLEEHGSAGSSSEPGNGAAGAAAAAGGTAQEVNGQPVAMSVPQPSAAPAPAAVIMADQGKMQLLQQQQSQTEAATTALVGTLSQQQQSCDRLQARTSVETHTSTHKTPPASHTSTATPAAVIMHSAPTSPRVAAEQPAGQQPQAQQQQQVQQAQQVQQQAALKQPQQLQQPSQMLLAAGQPGQLVSQASQQQQQLVSALPQHMMVNGQRVQVIASPGQAPQMMAVQLAGAPANSGGAGGNVQQQQQQQLQPTMVSVQQQAQPQQLVWAQGPNGPQLMAAAPANLGHPTGMADWGGSVQPNGQQMVLLQAAGNMLPQFVQVAAPNGIMQPMLMGGQLGMANASMMQPQLVQLPNGQTAMIQPNVGPNMGLMEQPQQMVMQMDGGMANGGQEASSRMQLQTQLAQNGGLGLAPGAILVQQGPNGMQTMVMVQQDGGAAAVAGLGGAANGAMNATMTLPAGLGGGMALLQPQQQMQLASGGLMMGKQGVRVSAEQSGPASGVAGGTAAMAGAARTLTLTDLSQQQMMQVQQMLAQQGIHAVLQ